MKEIKEKIDVNSLVPAPLDNKNVMLDWWKENMLMTRTIHSMEMCISDSSPDSP